MRAKLNFKQLNNRYLVPAYLFILFMGAVMPLGSGTKSILMDNFTLQIRWDYLLHAMIYMPLPLLLMFFFRERTALLLWFFVGLLGLLVPVMFEMMQMLIPYRSFNINDMVANGVGMIIGLITALILSRCK